MILVQAYTNKNLGDDLFLHILFTRYPDVPFMLMAGKEYRTFLTHYPNVCLIRPPRLDLLKRTLARLLSPWHKDLRLELQKQTWNRFLQEARKECNAYLYIGGSIFMQYADTLSIHDYVNRCLPLSFKHLFVVGANFGPYHRQEYVEYYRRKVFPRYTDICFRDRFSKALFSRLENVRRHPDVVFQYRSDRATAQTIPKSVGISVMDFSRHPDLRQQNETYRRKLAEGITRLHQAGHSVCLFSFCKNEGDEQAMNDIVNRLPRDVKVQTCRYDSSVSDFLATYARMETMLTLRFHSLVLSLLYGQKICPLVYSNKTTNLLDDLHYRHKSYPVQEASTWDVADMAARAGRIEYPLEMYALHAERQFDALDKYCHHHKPLPSQVHLCQIPSNGPCL